MKVIYKYTESAVKPEMLEINVDTVYLRKDIMSNTRADDSENSITMWTYQEAALTQEEFNAYTSFLMAENAIKGTNDSDNIVQIMTGQETGDNNQLAIMEAIADLYDAVATMGS